MSEFVIANIMRGGIVISVQVTPETYEKLKAAGELVAQTVVAPERPAEPEPEGEPEPSANKVGGRGRGRKAKEDDAGADSH